MAKEALHLRCLSLSLCTIQNGANTIAPGSQTISVEEGTVVAVAWLPQNSTAWFSWRGSVSKKDWLADFQLWWVSCLTICTHPSVLATAILIHLLPSSADKCVSHRKWNGMYGEDMLCCSAGGVEVNEYAACFVLVSGLC